MGYYFDDEDEHYINEFDPSFRDFEYDEDRDYLAEALESEDYDDEEEDD